VESPPHRAFDEVHQPRGFFNARAGFGAHVEENLAAIDAREEILPSQGSKRKAERQLSRNTGMKINRRWTSVVSRRW